MIRSGEAFLKSLGSDGNKPANVLWVKGSVSEEDKKRGTRAQGKIKARGLYRNGGLKTVNAANQTYKAV